MKTKTKWVVTPVLVRVTVLTSVPITNLYVLSVIDGVKMIQDVINWVMDATNRVMTLPHWAKQLQNWRVQL